MFVAVYYPQTVSVKTVVRRRNRRRTLQTIQPVEPYATLIGTGELSIKARRIMKRGYLERHEDVSGITGTGDVAEFVIASDGRVVIFWPVGEGVWPSLEDMMKVHGHGGKTIAVIIDDPMEENHCSHCHLGDNLNCPDHGASGCPACLNSMP